MKKSIYAIFIIFVATSLFCGCNIVPKSVQYQKEEYKLVGNTDVVNPIVDEIQVILNDLGYDTGNTDGRMGAKTREAIKEFQESIGVKNTGYINKTTLRQLEDIRRTSEESQLKNDYKIEVRSAYLGDSSKESLPTTKEIQLLLKNAGFDPGAVDGKMGPRTKQAVKEFQKTKGLKPDGVIGPKTWDELSKYIKE